MATEIVPMRAEHLPLVRHFAEQVWKRPRSDSFYRWRYERPRFHRAWLALRDGRCLGMECAFQRPYRVDDEVIEFLEVFDWFVLPELRKSGIGVRVMQRILREPLPSLLVGGSDDTQALMPRLGFDVPATAERWILPLGARRVADAIRQRLRVPQPLARLAASAALARPGRSPRPRGVPRSGRAIAVGRIGQEVQQLYERRSPYRALPLWTEEMLEWLAFGFPGVGHFVPLYFEQSGRLEGWSLLRIHPAPHGCDAEIVECFNPSGDRDLYRWMVSETATRAAAFRPGVLGGCSTCPALQDAFRANHFVLSSKNPVQVYGLGRSLPAPMLVGSNTGDNPIVPLPEGWWGDPDDAPPGATGAGPEAPRADRA